MVKKIFSFIAVGISLLMSLAADAVIEAEETEFAYGVVVSIDPASGIMVIKEEDYDTDIESDVTYYFNADTDYENIASISEIEPGNDVDISYTIQEDEKKTIKFVSVYKPDLETEEE